jgi:hypothetical protein
LGRPGGGATPNDDEPDSSESPSGGGIRFDLTRDGGFTGPPGLKSIADAERGGGDIELGLSNRGGFDRPGEAVCALDGGGGGTEGFSVWLAACEKQAIVDTL